MTTFQEDTIVFHPGKQQRKTKLQCLKADALDFLYIATACRGS